MRCNSSGVKGGSASASALKSIITSRRSKRSAARSASIENDQSRLAMPMAQSGGARRPRLPQVVRDRVLQAAVGVACELQFVYQRLPRARLPGDAGVGAADGGEQAGAR